MSRSSGAWYVRHGRGCPPDPMIDSRVSINPPRSPWIFEVTPSCQSPSMPAVARTVIKLDRSRGMLRALSAPTAILSPIRHPYTVAQLRSMPRRAPSRLSPGNSPPCTFISRGLDGCLRVHFAPSSGRPSAVIVCVPQRGQSLVALSLGRHLGGLGVRLGGLGRHLGGVALSLLGSVSLRLGGLRLPCWAASVRRHLGCPWRRRSCSLGRHLGGLGRHHGQVSAVVWAHPRPSSWAAIGVRHRSFLGGLRGGGLG